MEFETHISHIIYDVLLVSAENITTHTTKDQLLLKHGGTFIGYYVRDMPPPSSSWALSMSSNGCAQQLGNLAKSSELRHAFTITISHVIMTVVHGTWPAEKTLWWTVYKNDLREEYSPSCVEYILLVRPLKRVLFIVNKMAGPNVPFIRMYVVRPSIASGPNVPSIRMYI